MSISYATSPFSFVDSQYGTAATSTGIKVNVPIIFDRDYHRKVQVKVFWAKHGLIGSDTYNEGTAEVTAPGLPVIRKTEFNGQKGDTIVMHQRTNLDPGLNTGIVGGNQLVDREVGWDMNYKKVKIEQWRNAVRTDGGMNIQRNPVNESFEQTEASLLSDWTAQTMDSGLLYAAHYGYSQNLFRQYGHTNLAPTAVSNTLYGNNISTSRTIADLTGSGDDNVKGISFEIAEEYMKENFFDPITVEGFTGWLCLYTAKGKQVLYRDSEFRLAVQYARERGLSNPLFQLPGALIYSNCILLEYEKLRTLIGGYNPAGLTVSNAGAYNSSITEAAYTGIGGGVASTSLLQMKIFGANALALCEGAMRMGKRTEDDYGQIIGRDADNIWGAARLDWLDATGAAANNQSHLNMVLTLV